jgi:hypothetical protein
MLGPTDNLHFSSGNLGAFSAILVPDPAPLASVDQLEISVSDGMRDLGEGRIARVVIWTDVATANRQ